jgi:FkbM family methyltransferase
MRYDHVDIGTCDFEVADGVFSENKNYLLVEPMAEYLDRLPTGDNIKKENSACSCKNGSIDIFYVPEEDIVKLGLPMWMKGCSKIGVAHKIVIQYLQSHNIDFSIIKSKKINVISFTDLAYKYNISEIGILKIDTEGHDHIIFNEVAKLIKSNQLYCDAIMVEYIIGRYGNTDSIDDIAFSLRKIFPNVKIQSENLTISK